MGSQVGLGQQQQQTSRNCGRDYISLQLMISQVIAEAHGLQVLQLWAAFRLAVESGLQLEKRFYACKKYNYVTLPT